MKVDSARLARILSALPIASLVINRRDKLFMVQTVLTATVESCGLKLLEVREFKCSVLYSSAAAVRLF